jgi:Uma2 family endonuclease
VEEDESVVFHLGITPEVVVEIVSNTEGGEEEPDGKLGIYERMKVARYIVYDPGQQTGGEPLRIYTYRGGHLVRTDETWFDDIGLGVTLWRGQYRGLRGYLAALVQPRRRSHPDRRGARRAPGGQAARRRH